ncbi:MAG: LLM class F420-dependent oxidoreductase [Deltaproteobacteria bacterium]|nr:LLM class F420-dependent oxidoreductase [Deltaproteobacteria bacterium]
MAAPKIRFGVQTAPQNCTWEDLARAWEELDTLGFDTAWTFDHYVPIFSDPSGPCLEGWLTLAALAARTKKLRLGTLVTGVTYRNPAHLAKLGATLDHISNGRLEFGIGGAWFEPEHDAYNFPFPPVGERLDMLDEALHIIRQMWTEKAPSFQGRHYSIREARCEPKPVQKPHPPILVGGGGEKKTLRLVARHAQMWNAFGSAEVFERKIGILADHCKKEGTDVDAIEKSVLIPVTVTDDPEAANRLVRGISGSMGLSEEQARAQVLAGNPDEVEAQVRRYLKAGVTHFIAMTFAPFDRQMVGLRRFAKEVIPRFR